MMKEKLRETTLERRRRRKKITSGMEDREK
jgi:hypothetical protein